MQKVIYDKSTIRLYVKNILVEKIEKLEKYLGFTIEASRDVKKTPKYDSIREEIQNEIYHLDRQMFDLKSMLSEMKRVVNSPSEQVKLGSLVITNKARFYISVSLGEFFFNKDRFYAISQESPMGQMMIGKKTGDEFILNGIHQKIEDVL